MHNLFSSSNHGKAVVTGLSEVGGDPFIQLPSQLPRMRKGKEATAEKEQVG